jgi:antitoxin YefM
MQSISYTDARDHLKELIDTVNRQQEAVRIVRRDGRNAVLLSEDDYDSLQETLHLLSSPVNATRLEAARARGPSESIPWEEVKRRLGL